MEAFELVDSIHTLKVFCATLNNTNILSLVAKESGLHDRPLSGCP